MKTVKDLPDDAQWTLKMFLATSKQAFPTWPQEEAEQTFVDEYFRAHEAR